MLSVLISCCASEFFSAGKSSSCSEFFLHKELVLQLFCSNFFLPSYLSHYIRANIAITGIEIAYLGKKNFLNELHANYIGLFLLVSVDLLVAEEQKSDARFCGVEQKLLKLH